MTHVYYDRHADPRVLRGRRVALIGFGNQGEAQALNLRDSGVEVTVGLRPRSPRRRAARSQGLKVESPSAAAAAADLLMLLVPDEVQGELFHRELAPHLRPGTALGFSHGMACHFRLVRPPPEIDVILVAPKGPGRTLRERYAAGRGMPALVAVGQDATGDAWPLALAYASAIGCGRAGMVRTTFGEEAVTDLFGEQAVLTGGMAELARAAFEVLVERGYQPEVAYIECVQELLQLADLMFEHGIAGMREMVSSPARWGGMRGGRELVGETSRRRMRRMLKEIESGRYLHWLRELGTEEKKLLLRRDREHEMEQAGRWVRRKLHWPGR